MQELFPGYYRPTKEEFSTMWQQCIFVFDANVLLNIYRYTPQTREELFDIFEQLKERSWLPNQAMLEYFENREEVISQQYYISDNIETALSLASENIEAKYKRGHPFILALGMWFIRTFRAKGQRMRQDIRRGGAASQSYHDCTWCV
ncbi:MAG: PIN-like domain-containing protein [Ktedonobacteraceae bacterium]